MPVSESKEGEHEKPRSTERVSLIDAVMHSKLARLTPREKNQSDIQERLEEEADYRELRRQQLKEVVKNKKLEQQKADE